MNNFLKTLLVITLLLFLFTEKTTFAQDKEVIKKIIIDPNPKERLLIPSIEKKNEKIKLIPPKSISDETKKESLKEEIEAARKIQDEKINITRFAVLGMKIPSPTEKDKTSFCFDFSDIDKPGQLINVMKLFSDAKINITKIESRPSKKELGKYIFWMDINGHIKDQKLKNIFDQVKQMTSMLKIIGSYPEATNII